MWTNKSYVVVDNMSKNDQNVQSNNKNNTFVALLNSTLDKAFDIENGFNIKLKITNGDFTTYISNNELYIDPDSPIFNVESNENLNCLKDGNNNINYIAIIPYLIAEIQQLKAVIKQIEN